MKRILLCAIIALTFFGAKAQEEKNTLKLNPISALLNTGSIFYERQLDETMSAQLGVAYTGVNLSDTKFRGFALTPEVRFYVKKNAPRGMYAAPFLRYQDYTISDNEDKGSYRSMGGGLLLGHQWIYNSGFVLDLFFGPSYNNGNYKATAGDNEPDIKGGIEGFGIRLGLAIGLGF